MQAYRNDFSEEPILFQRCFRFTLKSSVNNNYFFSVPAQTMSAYTASRPKSTYPGLSGRSRYGKNRTVNALYVGDTFENKP